MKKLDIAVRVLLGLIYFVFGLNGFLNFIPMPPPDQIPEPLRNFVGALMASGFLFPFVKGTEVVCGALLLLNKFSGVALVALAPVTLNIFLVHAFLDAKPQSIGMAGLMVSCSVYLGIRNWAMYKPMFKGF